MAAIAVTEAITEGFGLIRRRPGTVLVWGAARTLYSVFAFGFIAPLFISRFEDILTRARGGMTTPPDLSSMMTLHSANLLLSVVGAFVGAALSCAVFRAVLKPEEGRFAYLRLGAAEAFLFLLSFGVAILFIVAVFVIVIPLTMVVVIAAVVHAAGAAVTVAVAGGIALFALLIFVLLRLSMAGPMMVEDGKFHLMDAWALTRGHVRDLFVIGISLVVILILIEVVLGAFALAIGLAFLSQAAGSLAAVHDLFTRPPAEIFAILAPGLIVVCLVAVPVFGCLWAILAAPWARAYRDLVGSGAAPAI
jgi:hypothetical protein